MVVSSFNLKELIITGIVLVVAVIVLSFLEEMMPDKKDKDRRKEFPYDNNN